MYDWITHTWNPIKGRCPHQCPYCYMKRFPVGDLRLDEKELKVNLGEGNTIFVGSSTDMWANEVDSSWIEEVLFYCEGFDNKYVFQSKNPARFLASLDYLQGSIFGTTIETNRISIFSGGDYPAHRARWLRDVWEENHNTFVTIEPIMDFDLTELVRFIEHCKPEFVNIGADSGHNNLPEPSADKIRQLITELEKFTIVKQKSNLARLLKG